MIFSGIVILFVGWSVVTTDHGGRTALVEYTNAGDYVATQWMPTGSDLRTAVKTGNYADGYGYEVPELSGQLRLITLSFNPEHDTAGSWIDRAASFGRIS